MRNALDGIYRIEVTKVRKPRSLDQNGWLFGCIYPILLDALLEAGWEFVSVEQVHEFVKAQMTADKVVNKHTGEIVEFPCSTEMCIRDRLYTFQSIVFTCRTYGSG